MISRTQFIGWSWRSSCLWLPSLALLGAPAVKPLSDPPVEAFNQACGRCHGSDGEHYVPGFVKKWPGRKLNEELQRMANGPGGVEWDEPMIQVQVRLHGAMSAGTPFIDWTASTAASWSGEVLNAQSLSAKVDGKTAKIEAKDGLWKLLRPAGSKGFVISAQVGSRSWTLDSSRSNIADEVPVKKTSN